VDWDAWDGGPEDIPDRDRVGSWQHGTPTPDCKSPALNAMLVAVVMIPVALNVSGLPARPGAVASSVFSPARVASVQLPTRATPEESVVALLGVRLPSSAPVRANVTGVPGMGLPYWSTTRTTGACPRVG